VLDAADPCSPSLVVRNVLAVLKVAPSLCALGRLEFDGKIKSTAPIRVWHNSGTIRKLVAIKYFHDRAVDTSTLRRDSKVDQDAGRCHQRKRNRVP
jgi:hypothetical protein